jgi:hypothetical protein
MRGGNNLTMDPLKEPYLKHPMRMLGRNEQKAGAQAGMPEKQQETSKYFLSSNQNDYYNNENKLNRKNNTSFGKI